MEVSLSPRWMLSTEHSACRRNRPLLVDHETGEAYRPQDIVRFEETVQSQDGSTAVFCSSKSAGALVNEMCPQYHTRIPIVKVLEAIVAKTNLPCADSSLIDRFTGKLSGVPLVDRLDRFILRPPCRIGKAMNMVIFCTLVFAVIFDVTRYLLLGHSSVAIEWWLGAAFAFAAVCVVAIVVHHFTHEWGYARLKLPKASVVRSRRESGPSR